MSDKLFSMTAPEKCPVCGGEIIDTDLMPEDDEFDGEAAELADESGHDERFSFIHVYAECGDCGEWTAYGPRWYFNHDSGLYDLSHPQGLESEPPTNNPDLYDRPLL